MTEINYYIVLLVSPSCLLPLASTLSFAVRTTCSGGRKKISKVNRNRIFETCPEYHFFLFNGTRNDRFFDFARILSLSLSLFVYKKAKKSTPMKAYCEKCINVIRESRWKEKRGERLCRKIGNIEGEGG